MTNVEDLPLNSFHKRLTVYSAGGPFLDGYVLSIIGVALVQAGPQLNMSASWEGLIGASALIGVFFGGFLGGWLTDKFGRQTLYTLDLIAIILCSVAQFWVQDVFWLFVLRLLIGIAVGADYPIATSLLAEFTPKKYRGPLIGALIVMWFVGAAVAYVVGELLLHLGPDGWRWMLASGALPAVVFVILRHGTPESPRWLANKGRVDEARAVVRRVFGDNASLESLSADEHGERIDTKVLFRSGYGKRMVFISIFWTCSIIPLFAIYAFAPKILDALGLTGPMANIGSAVITILFLVGSLVFVLLINRMGRRKVILHSFLWSGVALLGLGLFPQSPALVILMLFAAYAVFIGGAQILQWVYPNELFPTEIRGSAVGLASSLSRIGAAAGTYLVPWSLVELGIGMTMMIAAGITLLGFLVSWRMAPETKGLSLDEAAAL
ncbi:MFS transporter [Arthrobacter mobilis]|uniref:MFS transporter n=1 Tax=Arthrobacter mobilis TaxID=2724944 RepID=A0A7X6QMP5_9MICC|nr:MFS transporter [Arthrobacter mobilis]NKX56660.1 MFS transporter [Arthrobacter mobilis]